MKGCKIKFPFLHQNIEFHSILYTQGTFGCWYYKFITFYKNISCHHILMPLKEKLMLMDGYFKIMSQFQIFLRNTWIFVNKINVSLHRKSQAKPQKIRVRIMQLTPLSFLKVKASISREPRYWWKTAIWRQSQYWVFGEKDVIMVSLLMSQFPG